MTARLAINGLGALGGHSTESSSRATSISRLSRSTTSARPSSLPASCSGTRSRDASHARSASKTRTSASMAGAAAFSASRMSHSCSGSESVPTSTASIGSCTASSRMLPARPTASLSWPRCRARRSVTSRAYDHRALLHRGPGARRRPPRGCAPVTCCRAQHRADLDRSSPNHGARAPSLCRPYRRDVAQGARSRRVDHRLRRARRTPGLGRGGQRGPLRSGGRGACPRA